MAKSDHFVLDIKGINKDLNRSMLIWKKQAKIETPKITGDLKRSVRTVVTEKKGIFEGTIYNDTSMLQKSSIRKNADVKYPFYVHGGTKAHTIVPKGKKLLTFKVKGKWVRTKKVNMPARKANPYFDRSFKIKEKEINNQLMNWDLLIKRA